MRVVVADQDLNFLGRLESFLRRKGHEVVTVSDGLACLYALRECEPDILAISNDLLWGGSDGILSVMLDEAELCNIPVLLLQGEDGNLGVRRHPMILSAVRRPFQLDELTSQLHFLALLGAEERRQSQGKARRYVANPNARIQTAMWNA